MTPHVLQGIEPVLAHALCAPLPERSGAAPADLSASDAAHTQQGSRARRHDGAQLALVFQPLLYIQALATSLSLLRTSPPHDPAPSVVKMSTSRDPNAFLANAAGLDRSSRFTLQV